MLKSAARAAIVMPAVFALAYLVIGQPQTALFAAFGSFAMLALAEFSGPARLRLLAYLGLAAGGAGLVVLGTLCSQDAWLAAAAMAVTGFVIFFLGMVNGVIAAGETAAVLAFVLAVSVPVPLSAIPARLAGWGLAAGAAIAAAMLLWPPRLGMSLRGEASRTCAVLAGLADALAGDQAAVTERTMAAQDGVAVLRRRLAATPHRLTGPAGPAAALVSLADELGWLCSSLTALAGRGTADVCRDHSRQVLIAVAGVLRDSSRLLAGRRGVPRTGPLETAQENLARTLAQRIPELPPVHTDPELESLVARSFQVHAIAQTTRQIAAYAIAGCGRAGGRPQAAGGPDTGAGAAAGARAGRAGRAGWVSGARAGRASRTGWVSGARAAVSRLAAMTGGHASVRSVWFRNSARAAAGLAIAVFVAHRSGLQYSFWVVLGALSVLRSNVLGTGRSVVAALAGTAVGIGIGAAILIPAGTNSAVLWALLPPAVLLAAYTPRAFPFAVGQAAFTAALLVLFNILEPVGWMAGLIRIQDVAVGCAISLAVGLVFWPRGAGALLREQLARTYASGAGYAAAALQRLAGGPPSDLGQAGQAAGTAIHLLDDAFRAYLAEQSAKPVDPERMARLVAGAARLVRTGQSLAALGVAAPPGSPALRPCGRILREDAQALRAWYGTFSRGLSDATAVPPPRRDPGSRGRLLACARAAIAGRATAREALDPLPVLWASQHLDAIWELEAHLGRQAAAAPVPVPAPVQVDGPPRPSGVSA